MRIAPRYCVPRRPATLGASFGCIQTPLAALGRRTRKPCGSGSIIGEKMAEGEVSALVIDNGSGMVKAGFAGDCFRAAAPSALYLLCI